MGEQITYLTLNHLVALNLIENLLKGLLVGVFFLEDQLSPFLNLSIPK